MKKLIQQYIETVKQALIDIPLLKDSVTIRAYCTSYDIENGLCFYIRHAALPLWTNELEVDLSQLIKEVCTKNQLERVVRTGYIAQTPYHMNYDKEHTIKSLQTRLKLAQNLNKSFNKTS